MPQFKKYKFSDFVEINPPVKLKAGENYSFIEMADLTDGQRYVYPSTERTLTGGARFEEGDTLFARITPCLENGKICQAKGLKEKEGFGSTEFLVFRGKKGISNSNFVFYLSRWDDVRRFAELNMVGTSGRQRVPKDVFENLELDLPSLPTQTRIAAILSSLDDKIELNRRTNATLEAMAQTLFKKYFVEDIDPDNLPDGWSKGKVSEYVNIVYGKNLPTNQLLETGYPVFGGNGLIGFHSKYLYEKPQVIIACRGSGSGTVNQTLPNSFITNNSLVFEYSSKANVGFSYLKYYLKSSDLMPFVTGSAQPQITIENISNLDFIQPERIVLNKFNEIADSLEYKMLSNHFEIETLNQIRDSLLPKLMSGEIEVNAAENELVS